MAKAGPQSSNPSGQGNLAAAVSYAFKKYLQDTDNQLPAKVLSYSRSTNRARLQIMVPFVTTRNEVQQRAIVASVPVLQLGGGGFLLSFPIAPGDLGWIHACDRDISNFKNTFNSSSGPPTQRMHSFSDAMFVPDSMMQGVTLADNDGVCLQSTDGTLSIVLTGDEIKITSPNKITFTAPEIDFDSVNCSINGIRFDTHEHTGVQTGPSKTGGPVNP